MRTQDVTIFAQAARKFNLWILVRRTNPKSLQYVALPGYTPKRIDCKAKTADKDVGSYKLAGLVVDPEKWPNAFRTERLSDVRKNWEKFLRECIDKPGKGYAIEQNENSSHFGCATFENKYIHGDYDLYDIIIPQHARRNLAAVETLHGQPHLRGPKVNPVKNFINELIGVPMVQHGGEMQYTDHSEQSIDVFGPGGENFTILNEFSVRRWYKDKFEGRKPLGVM